MKYNPAFGKLDGAGLAGRHGEERVAFRIVDRTMQFFRPILAEGCGEAGVLEETTTPLLFPADAEEDSSIRRTLAFDDRLIRVNRHPLDHRAGGGSCRRFALRASSSCARRLQLKIHPHLPLGTEHFGFQ